MKKGDFVKMKGFRSKVEVVSIKGRFFEFRLKGSRTIGIAPRTWIKK